MPGFDDLLVAQHSADAGLLIIHGVGSHSPGVTLKGFIEPFLARLDEEGQLIEALSTRLGDANAPEGTQEAITVRYDAGRGPRQLLIVEGRWDASFVKSGADTISGWLIRSSPRMLWGVLRYHARGWFSPLVALLALAAFCTGIYVSRDDPRWLPIALIVGSLVLAGSFVFLTDAVEFRNGPLDWRGRLTYVPALVGTLIVYQFQRALVVIVSAAGIVIAPVGLAILRLVASIPFLSGFVLKGLLPGLERALLTGGVADMQAVVGNEVTAASIRSRLHAALEELESRLAPGATLTVVAHSGGAPVAWDLLTEVSTAARPSSEHIRYRLITAGAALNWAYSGFEGHAMHLTRPLAHYDRPAADQTYWMNVYSTWDPVPHGPAPHRAFGYAARWEEPDNAESPNRLVRNLGAPVPDEHGEYWRNQQEFVPIVARAVDDQLAWAQRDGGPDMRRWAHARLALLSTLVRVRITVLAIPLVAAISIPLGARLVGPDARDDRLSGWLRTAGRNVLEALLGEDAAARVIGWLEDFPVLVTIAGALVLFLVALAVLDLYTNVCWYRLGRRAASLRPKSRSIFRAVEPVGAILLWLPALALPAILFPLGLGRGTHITLAAVNTLLCLLEWVWLSAALRALGRHEGFDFMATAIGRERSAAVVSTPAGQKATALLPDEQEVKRCLTVLTKQLGGRAGPSSPPRGRI